MEHNQSIDLALCDHWAPLLPLINVEIILQSLNNPNLLDGRYLITKSELESKHPFRLTLFYTSRGFESQLIINAANPWLLYSSNGQLKNPSTPSTDKAAETQP